MHRSPRPRLLARLLALLLGLASPLIQGQTDGPGALSPRELANTALLVDFGTSTYPSGTAGSPVWNDVLSGALGTPQGLVDSTGSATGIVLGFDPNALPIGANEAGVVTPTAGSPLAQLGWPASATRDTFYGSSARPEVAFVLAGLDPGASYDFTILASRMGVSDARTTRYAATGFNGALTELDPSNNTSNVARLAGVVPDLAGAIRFALSPAPSNTNPSSYFYLNALRIDETPGGATGPLLAFTTAQLALSRAEGAGPVTTSLGTQTLSGATPVVALSALDDATGMAPTWLTLDASTVAGSSFALTADPDGLPVRTVSATLTASAAGYPDASAQVRLTVRTAGTLNLLYYGNSYSQGNGTVPALVQALAERAGFPTPNTVARLVGGQTLNFHLTDPVQAAAITGALPTGESWDFVVLQGFSTEATTQIGNPTQFRADALAILTNVRAHSPAARACLFQTWARGRGHSFYQGASPAFSGPLQMHSEIEESYTLAEADMNAAFGPDTCRRAAAGVPAFLSAFDPALYTADLSHPEPEMTVLASLTIFSRMYGRRASELAVDFGGSSSLAQRLAGWGIDPDAWGWLAGLADRAAPPSLRRFAGSGEDYLLLSGSAEALDARPYKELVAGDPVVFRLLSPNGLAGGQASMLWLDLDPTSPPWSGPAGFPELWLRTGSALLLAQSPALPFEGGHGASWTVPPALLGRHVLVQGQVLWPSPRTGSPFTTSDAHELRVVGAPRRRASAVGPRR